MISLRQQHYSRLIYTNKLQKYGMSHEVIINCHFIGVAIHQHDSTKYDFNKSYLEYNYVILLLAYPSIYFYPPSIQQNFKFSIKMNKRL